MLRVLDGERKRREGKRADLEFAGCQRRDYRRRAFEVGRFGDIGPAEMLQEYPSSASTSGADDAGTTTQPTRIFTGSAACAGRGSARVASAVPAARAPSPN